MSRLRLLQTVYTLKVITYVFDSAAEVQRKIKSIRTQYGREGQKVVKRKSGDGFDDIYVSKWPHFDNLQFLADFVTAKRSVSNFKVLLNIQMILVLKDTNTIR